ncbi:MAG: hypothetical protein J7L25_00950 [Deltaproteobacteria bacterium]|nr:hypothetical protein [Candidatus Tharpella aukensis]
MVEKNKVRRFLWPSIFIGLLAALFLLLPLISLPGLKDRLVDKLSTTLQQPCRIREVRLRLLPRPAISVQDVTCSGPGFNLKTSSLELEFSLYSLISFSPLVDSIHLRGVLAEIPFTVLLSEDGLEEEFFSLSLERLGTLFKSQERDSTLVSLDDAICKVTNVPGLKKPLLFTALAGRWHSQPHSQSENLELSGSLNGGRARLQVTWYKVEDVSAADSGSQVADDGDRLEISCCLQGVSLPEPEAAFFGAYEKRWQVDFEKGDLEIDVNGNPEAGLRFSGKVAVVDHHLSRYDRDRFGDLARLWSQGALQTNFSGFFQRREGYLNIKSAAFEYPGAATLFTRGLIRFRKPLFVDLVNHLKVDDLAKTLTHCPLLQLSGYQCLGRLEGELKLIGNPLQTPVLQAVLNSEKIVLRAVSSETTEPPPIPEADSELTQPELKRGESAALEVVTGDRSPAPDYQKIAANFLRSLAQWEWIVKSDCRIGLLELPDLRLTEFSFLAEKDLVQLEIERLAAHFAPQGEVRLSLILDDFLHQPRWQASLVVKKLDLKPFIKTLSLTGILNASLVGGGRLGDDFEGAEELVFNGKWLLRQGRFGQSPLFTAFNLFLEQERGARATAEFSGFSGKFALRDEILRLDELKLSSSGSQLNARGRFFGTGERLDFRGRLNKKESLLLPFRLSGELDKPLFTTD